MKLEERYVAPMLSHHSFGGLRMETPMCFRRDWIHKRSTVVFASDLYSDLVLERATFSCFLELQEMRLNP
jgi:hypothetical protein